MSNSNGRSKVDRRKKTPTTATAAVAMDSGGAPGVSRADIARKAYELFCARGCQHGQDLEDWFNAERELYTPAAVSRRRVTRQTTRPD